MTLVADIKSERFIHDSLVAAARQMLEVVRTGWNKNGRIDAMIVAWPAEVIASDQGRPIDGPCLGVLETVAVAKRREAIAQFARRTNAYALLLIEQRAQAEVTAVFESPHGVCCWAIPVERHGDRWVATRLEERNAGESVGILRQP